MGEWMEQVPVKLKPHTKREIIALGEAQPIPVGASTVIRHIVERFLVLMSSGIVQFAAEQGNRVLSVQSIPGTPEQVPAFPVDGRAKPLTRIVAPPSKGVRGRAISHVSRMDVANRAWVTSFPFKSTRFKELAA